MRGERESEWATMRRCLAIVARLMEGEATPGQLLDIVREADSRGASESALAKRLENDMSRIREIVGAVIEYSRATRTYALLSAGVFETLRRRVEYQMSLPVRAMGYAWALRRENTLDAPIYLQDVLGIVIPDKDEWLNLRAEFLRGAADAGEDMLLVQRDGRVVAAARCELCQRVLPITAKHFYFEADGRPKLTKCRPCYNDPLAAHDKAVRQRWYARLRYRNTDIMQRQRAANAKWSAKNKPLIARYAADSYIRRREGVITLRGAAVRTGIPEYVFRYHVRKGTLALHKDSNGHGCISVEALNEWLRTPQATRIIHRTFRVKA